MAGARRCQECYQTTVCVWLLWRTEERGKGKVLDHSESLKKILARLTGRSGARVTSARNSHLACLSLPTLLSHVLVAACGKHDLGTNMRIDFRTQQLGPSVNYVPHSQQSEKYIFIAPHKYYSHFPARIWRASERLLASWAARHVLAHLPDTRHLSPTTPACSSAWYSPAELRDTYLPALKLGHLPLFKGISRGFERYEKLQNVTNHYEI